MLIAWSSVHAFLIINHSDIVESGTVLLDKSLMSWIFGDIIISILLRCKFNHETMREATLQGQYCGWRADSSNQPEHLLGCCQCHQMKTQYMVCSMLDACMSLSSPAYHRRTTRPRQCWFLTRIARMKTDLFLLRITQRRLESE